MEIFRTFEHSGRSLQLASNETEGSSNLSVDASLAAPGSGKIEINALKIASGENLTLTARVAGDRIAFIYCEILLHDNELGQYYGPIAREYVRAEKDVEVQGVSHPDWDTTLDLKVTLSPGMRVLSDGVSSAFACLTPTGYANPVYQLDGIYASADETTQRRARLIFDRSGQLTKVMAFKKQGNSFLPHGLTFERGDRFSPFVEVLTPPTDQNQAWQGTRAHSTTLTFQGQPFGLATETLMPAEYLAGLLVQDLDGKITRQYASFSMDQ
jgi:hypothetical protein